MDLTAAEGLADLLAAQTGHQRRVALAQASGALHRLYTSWQEEALRCLAHAEAVVDFGEEAHLGDSVAHDVAHGITRLRDTLAAHVGAAAAGTGGPATSYELTQGARVRVTLGGAPNAGKSSLFNALLGRDAAIVSPVAGTTRDVLTHGAAVGPAEAAVALTDTAGLRHAPGDEVEAQGVVRAAHALRDAHVRVLVIDAAAAWAGQAGCVPQADHWAHATSSEERQQPHTVVVLSKADLVEQQARGTVGVVELMRRLPHWVQALTPGAARGEPPHPIAGPWLVSTLTGAGLSQLTQALARAAGDAGLEHGRPLSTALLPAVTRARHAHALRAALAHLDAAVEAATRRSGQGPSRDELIAEELRSAHVALCTVTGKVHCTEDVLDAVFRDFCIGK
jgi:tRNA modification GTPase